MGLRVFNFRARPERTTSGEHEKATGLQKAQTSDNGINQVLTWIRKQPRPFRSHLQGLPRNVWKLWNLFDELTIRQGNLCGKHKKLKRSQMIFQQVVPLN